MNDFKELQKSSRNITGKLIKLALLSDNSTQLLSTAIKGYGAEYGMNINIFEAGYDQIDLLAFNNQSILYTDNFDFILIYISSEKLYDKFINFQNNKRENFADEYISYINTLINTIKSQTKSKFIIFNFISLENDIFGNYSLSVKSSFSFQIMKLNYLLNEQSILSSIHILDFNKICQLYGYNNIINKKYYYAAKITINMEYLPVVAKNITDIISAAAGQMKKCVILDLDNTLWGGVVGDEGCDKIQIGSLGNGYIYTDIQKYFKELKNRGIILAVCSKNDENNAKEPFLKNKEMVLSLDDITVFTANWKDKASNIADIQKQLNISYDSMVFIDDNPAERELVKNTIPDITVPDLPNEPEKYLSFIKSLNLFETASFSKEDVIRTNFYHEEFKRNENKKQFSSIDEYLANLEMRASVKPIDNFNYARTAQLTQRTNQFNMRSSRYTDEDIINIMHSKEYASLIFNLKDKFGDYGIISAVILKISNNNIFIDTWVMSCRVFGRSLENFIMHKIIEYAKTHNISTVTAEYIQTNKNTMLKNLYLDFNFKKENNLFILNTADYKEKKYFIKEETNV
ncbi:MAG: HAD-IIIC family phosphatase [Candidatus Mucispirillum faecigallinarum]|nr:HAD-IIIC family phosphatase [Candidatus Mucispirillum faecigallinarum]